MPDAVDTMAAQPDSGLFSANGLFSKLIDTAGDVYAIQQQNRNTPAPGSVYPTGQTNPTFAAQDRIAASGPNAPASSPQAVLFQYMPYIIGAAALVTIVAIALRFRK
jgi:hypothetical protein